MHREYNLQSFQKEINNIKKKVKKIKKHPYLFQYKISYRNEIRTKHYGLLSTSI